MKTWQCDVCQIAFTASRKATNANKCPSHRHWRQTNCTTCGSKHWNSNRNRDGRRVYCSDTCRPWKKAGNAAPASQLDWTQCHCGRWISKPGKRYCDRACWYEAWAQDRRNRHCQVCNVTVGPRRRFCEQCARARKRQSDARARRTRRAKYGRSFRARARRFKVDYELVNRQKVFTRDGWRCGICAKKVDKRLKAPHPMAASLDHIVPMSHGGGHTYINTQCAHHLCNSLKSDRHAGDQLALIG